MADVKFKITNIDCDACVKLSLSELRDLPGAQRVLIEKDGTGKVEGTVSFEQVKDALAAIGKNAVDA